jgi:hypothetical protein
MPRVQAIRNQVQELLSAVPFRPFVLTLENGRPVPVDHPENIAFIWERPGEEGSEDFYVAWGKNRVTSTFDAVTDITPLVAQTPPGNGAGEGGAP